MKPKHFIKHSISRISALLSDYYSKGCQNKSHNSMTTEVAIDVLKKYGYKFNKLWDDKLPVLKPDTIDCSIIIPVYNAAKFLKRTLDSIVNQNTKYKYEVICIDDGSKDQSLDILRDYKQRYPDLIKVFSQPNMGISRTRNSGIECAYGKYIGFMDNDDYVEPEYIENCVSAAIDADADIVQTGYDEVTLDNIILKSVNHSKKCFTLEMREKRFDCVHGFIWGGILKKEIFNNVRFPVGFWFEDMITRMLIMRMSKTIIQIDGILYHKTSHKENASLVLWNKNEIKSLDQYWLASSFVELAEKDLHIENDELLDALLLQEWSGLLWSRIRGLPKEVKEAAFALCSEFYKTRSSAYIPIDKRVKNVKDAFLGNNYKQWYLASMSVAFWNR